MDFRLLGTFEVTREGSVVTPSAPKLRQVLALLAMHGNRLVQTRQLVDELWEDRPPVSSSTTLQTYIYQLRKLLDLGDADGRCSLSTRPGGYQLTLPPQALDVRRFEELAGRGAEELRSGKVESAAETLRAALAIWRGPVLPDVTTGPILQAEAVQLDERRNGALEMRLDAELALGRYPQLISELTGETTRHPTHEGMHGRLMLALYRAGRRSEALGVYQRIRHTLGEELGLEPGPELQRIHRAVLASDAELDSFGAPGTVSAVTPAPPLDPPAQLPPDTTLVGRQRELAHAERVVRRSASGTPEPLLVVGAPGVGTTSFCVHVAHRVRHLFPDGQFFASFGESTGPAEILAGFLRSIGVPDARIPDDLDGRSAMFRSWTADRKVLVLLDDVAGAAQLAPLFPAGRGCATIAAGHRRLCDHTIGETVELRPLDTEDSLRLLAAVAGERIRQELDAAHSLVTACAGVPMALRAAAAQLALRPHWRVSHLASRLTTESRRLHELSAGGLDLRHSVCRRFRLLPYGHREALGKIAVHTGDPVGADEAAGLLGVSPTTAETILEHLVEHQLAEVDAAGDGFRYRLNPLVRLAARTLGLDREPYAQLPVSDPLALVPAAEPDHAALAGTHRAG